MAGPGDEVAATENLGRRELRASHADRERVIGTLKAAFVQGMLAKSEFDQRVGQAFASRTCAELAALTADLQVEPVTARSAQPARRGEQPVLRPGPMLAVGTAIYASVWAFAAVPPWPVSSEGDPPRAIIMLVFLSTLIYLLVSAISVGNMVADRIQRRAARRPVPGPGGR